MYGVFCVMCFAWIMIGIAVTIIAVVEHDPYLKDILDLLASVIAWPVTIKILIRERERKNQLAIDNRGIDWRKEGF